MENRKKNKLIGNLSSETHRKINIIKAERGFRSLEETLKFILDIFDLVDEDVKIKYINNIGEKNAL